MINLKKHSFRRRKENSACKLTTQPSQKTLSLLLVIICLIVVLPFEVQAQTKNEISFHTNLVRGGFVPETNFDGSAIGFSYNREIHPFIMIHSNLVAVQLFEQDDSWIDANHNNGMVNTDFGIEIAPFDFKRFQIRFGVAGSLQIRNSTDTMDPETLTGIATTTFIGDPDTGDFEIVSQTATFYSFRSYHLGYKFELKFPVKLFDRFFIAPTSTMRSYPRGNYIPNIFEVGLQGGIKF